MQYLAFERVLGDQHAGGEFAAAAAEARRLGARVVLGDRDVDLTQRRLRRLTPLIEVVQFALGWEDGAWARRQAELSEEAEERVAQSMQQAERALAEAEAVRAAQEEEACQRAAQAAMELSTLKETATAKAEALAQEAAAAKQVAEQVVQQLDAQADGRG